MPVGAEVDGEMHGREALMHRISWHEPDRATLSIELSNGPESLPSPAVADADVVASARATPATSAAQPSPSHQEARVFSVDHSLLIIEEDIIDADGDEDAE
jgi:hypothetical protein